LALLEVVFENALPTGCAVLPCHFPSPRPRALLKASPALCCVCPFPLVLPPPFPLAPSR